MTTEPGVKALATALYLSMETYPPAVTERERQRDMRDAEGTAAAMLALMSPADRLAIAGITEATGFAEQCPDRCGGVAGHSGPHQSSDYNPAIRKALIRLVDHLTLPANLDGNPADPHHINDGCVRSARAILAALSDPAA